jgi:hypothetical protein
MDSVHKLLKTNTKLRNRVSVFHFQKQHGFRRCLIFGINSTIAHTGSINEYLNQTENRNLRFCIKTRPIQKDAYVIQNTNLTNTTFTRIISFLCVCVSKRKE